MTDIDADFTESKPDEHLEAIRQEHEPFLTMLEALAVLSIATNDWDAFYELLINFQSQNDLHGVCGVAFEEDAA